ncbi:MAG: serine hydrolase [Negativicutes bacterium]
MLDKSQTLAKLLFNVTKNEPGAFALAFQDPSNGFEWNFRSLPMRSASLIKLFIMVESFEQITANRLDPATAISFFEKDLVAGSGILQELPVGTYRTVFELIELMITESDNIATNLLIDLLGMEPINARIRSLGCSETILRRRMMDFAAAEAGQENLTSARDVIRLLARLYNANCVSAEADAAMCSILGRQTDRCKIPLLLPSNTICQHKTGELPGAEHDAGIVRTSNGAYLITIMSDDLPDPEHGRQVIAQLSRIIYDWYEQASFNSR